jgi:hypothetical protein
VHFFLFLVFFPLPGYRRISFYNSPLTDRIRKRKAFADTELNSTSIPLPPATTTLTTTAATTMTLPHHHPHHLAYPGFGVTASSYHQFAQSLYSGYVQHQQSSSCYSPNSSETSSATSDYPSPSTPDISTTTTTTTVASDMLPTTPKRLSFSIESIIGIK